MSIEIRLSNFFRFELLESEESIRHSPTFFDRVWRWEVTYDPWVMSYDEIWLRLLQFNRLHTCKHGSSFSLVRQSGCDRSVGFTLENLFFSRRSSELWFRRPLIRWDLIDEIDEVSAGNSHGNTGTRSWIQVMKECRCEAESQRIFHWENLNLIWNSMVAVSASAAVQSKRLGSY